MNDVIALVVDGVRREPGVTLLVAVGAYLVLLVLVLWTMARYNRLAKRQARLLRGTDGTNLEQMLVAHMDAADTVRAEIDRAAAQGATNASSLRQCLQKVGLVRYDAFADVGGEQSFSLALLDAGDNGLVISSLFSRHSMRVYAKPVVAGASPLSLTDEERQAIRASRVSGSSPTDTTNEATAGRIR